jgi:hypothetical protein
MHDKPNGTRLAALACGVATLLLLLTAADPIVPGDPPVPQKTAKKATARVKNRRAATKDTPPPCPPSPSAQNANRRQARRPAPTLQTMPEFFARMGQQFAQNPAQGFQTVLGDLAEMEGPALNGIRLSYEEERAAGEKARLEYLRRAEAQGFTRNNDPELRKYVRELVEGLSKHMATRSRYKDIEITLLNAPISDGQSFPGGMLVFTTALFDEADEATIAGVVAHELAHLECRHLYNYARRSKLFQETYARPPGGPADFDQFFQRQMALFGLMMNPYRPEHEHEADCVSVTWLYQDGYDPTALMRFFERLHNRRNDAPNGPFDFGRTHPFSLDRREAVRRRVAQLQRWKSRADLGLYPDNLRRRVSRYHVDE